MSKYWIIADTHLGHEKAVEWGRPSNFSQTILTNACRMIKEGVLIHLGDVCIGDDIKWNHELTCIKAGTGVKCWLVKGNHDQKSNSFYLSHGWDFVADSFIMDIFGKRICFSHEPKFVSSQYDLNLHGHLHGGEHRIDEFKDVLTERNVLISLEGNGYVPLDLQKIVERSGCV